MSEQTTLERCTKLSVLVFYSYTSGQIFLFRPLFCLFLPLNASKCEVYTGQGNLLANREAVVPECVGGGVHEQEASVSQLQLHRLDLSSDNFPPSISVPEYKIPRCP